MLFERISAVEDRIAIFTNKLEATMLLLHMFSYVILFVAGIVALGALPQPPACPVHRLKHL